MAEYYPLISRAVAGLRTGTPEARRAIYDRAKQALIGQLRTMDPPVPEEAIARETVALDEAIARVEAEVAPPKADNVPPKASAGDARVAAAPSAAKSVPKPTAPAAPVLGGVRRSDRPEVKPRPTLPPLRSSSLRSARPEPLQARVEPALMPTSNDAPALNGGPEANVAPEPTGTEPAPSASSIQSEVPAKTIPEHVPEGATASAVPVANEPDAPALPAAPVLRVPRPNAPELRGAPVLRPSPRGESAEPAETTDDKPPRPAEENLRPAAPRPVEKTRPDLRVFIVALAALAAVVAVAFTAWKLRDRPEELSRAPVAAKAQDTAPGKIVERADDAASADTGTVSSDTSITAALNNAATPPPSAPVGSSDNNATTVPSVPDASTPASSPVAAAGAPAAVGAAPAAEQGVPVAYKAAILVEAPDEPQKVKTFVGTVVWRTETVNPGQDQPVGTAIDGDIDIPDAKVKLSFEMRKNIEAPLLASHTIELKFTVANGSPISGVKQINVPQMRREDMPTGDPLAGVPATIADNYFLVGLTRGSFEDANLELIKTRNWFDVPMLLVNGKAAKITFEKGAGGERIFNDVLQNWKAATP